MEIEHRMVQTNGIRMHVAEAGTGKLVVLCHGFPESWYSWRHQIEALAREGYHVIAPDLRGYGETERPTHVDAYTILHLVGDVLGLLDVFEAPDAVLIGHDWGAPLVWHAALFRPDRVRAVAGLSVPFASRAKQRPTLGMPRGQGSVYYHLYFQQPQLAEAELERDPLLTLRRLIVGASGDARLPGVIAPGFAPGMVPEAGGFLHLVEEPNTLPHWLSQSDLDYVAQRFAQSGFGGAINWYRNIDRNWELLAPWADAKVTVPALYIVGDRDLVYARPGNDQAIANLKQVLPGLRETIVLPGCGHWTQQERPQEVNAALLSFLASLS